MKSARYADPYFAGIGLGLVLLAAYVMVGRGLGASGAFASVVAAAQGTAIESPLHDWLVLELIGVMLGGFLSAKLARRTQVVVEHGSQINNRQRMAWAITGGILMGFGARLARGCTSGQALTGGAQLTAGSWIFVMTCFAAGYVVAPLARRLWR